MRGRLAEKLEPFGTTIFAEMTRLAVEHGAVNLGQGFPNFDGPQAIMDAVTEAMAAGHNQYARSQGVPVLNAAIAAHQARFYGLRYDPDTEVTVTSGATEGIFSAIQGLCDPGDEVILFEPFYDSYRASVAMAGAQARVVSLQPPHFGYDRLALERAFTPRTRALLLNTPHNPTGKVFSREELEHIAALCKRHDVVVIADEVYEHLVFDGQHVSMATLEGMRERTMVLSSAGKTFSLTGWKIGWCCAPPELSRAIRAAHQFVTFATGTPFQHAIARALGFDDDYYDGLRTSYLARRDRLHAGLSRAGFAALRPAGTYFICADIRPLGATDDMAFCRALPERVGVVAVPCSVFCENPTLARHLVRFAFCKTDDVLDEAVERLTRLE